MKRFILILLIVVAGVFTTKYIDNANAAPASFTFQVFYDELGPYGTWVNYPSYGYVWVPGVGSGFVPYCTGGHWEYATDYGWIWVSDYAWGWAPFHYGRWFYEDVYGWMWVPGYEWAPAWVVWGSYSGYYGWAPVGPGISITMGYRPPARYWVCVPEGRIHDRHVFNYRVQNTTVINNITVINNTRTYGNQKYFSGPHRETVEKDIGRRIQPVSLAERSRPGATKIDRNRLEVFRPDINKEQSGRMAPAKTGRLEDLRQNGKSPAGIQQHRNSNNNNGLRQQRQPVRQQQTQPVRRDGMQRSNTYQRNESPLRQQRHVQPSERYRNAPMQNRPPVQNQPPQPSPLRQQRQQPRQMQPGNSPLRQQSQPINPSRSQPGGGGLRQFQQSPQQQPQQPPMQQQNGRPLKPR